MRTINIFKAAAILLLTCASLSCSDLFNWGTRDYSTQLEIGVTKGGSALKGATNDPIYYLDDCELVTADAIRISIATPVVEGDPIPVENMQDKILPLHSVGDGVASDLVMLLPGTYVITKFEVLQLIEDNGSTHYETIMATPMENSAFSGYVNTPLNFEFTVELYQKKRVLMEVLCFEPTDVASFGFVWTGVNVILGDEICLYVSQCTSNGTETWGPADYSATFYTMTDQGEGEIYASSGTSSDGWICFPLWSGATTYGVGVHIEYNGGADSAEFVITPEEVTQILAELQNDPVNTGEGYYSYEIPCLTP